MGGFVNARNTNPARQRLWQTKFKQDVPLWKIGPRAKFLLPIYQVTLFGTLSASLWCMGRMVLGHKSWWGKD